MSWNFCLYLSNKLPLLNQYKSKSIGFQKLLKEQLIEPKLEAELSKNISKIGSINDQVSIKVMEQYQKTNKIG